MSKTNQVRKFLRWLFRFPAPSVKPLIWFASEIQKNYYSTNYVQGCDYSVQLQGDVWKAQRFGVYKDLCNYTTEAAAKAACQRDHEQRVLALIDLDPPALDRESAPGKKGEER
jgi:hypothetical protein